MTEAMVANVCGAAVMCVFFLFLGFLCYLASKD